MSEPLWSDERIANASLAVGNRWVGKKVSKYAVFELGYQMAKTAQEVRSDYEAALAAANQRIAELEANADPEALAVAYAKGRADGQEDCRKRIAELEARGEWEPVGNYTFGPTLDSDGLVVLAMRTSDNGRIITLETMDMELEIDMQDKCLCRRKEDA